MKNRKSTRILVAAFLTAVMGVGTVSAAAAAIKGPGSLLPWKKTGQTSGTSAGNAAGTAGGTGTGAAGWQEAYPNGLREEGDVRSYLSGTWAFLNNGDVFGLQDNPEKSFSFFPEEKRALFTKDHGAHYVDSSFSLEKINDEAVQGQDVNLMTLTPKEASAGFLPDREFDLGLRTDMQILTANVMGEEILALREIGNGESELATYGLGFDGCAADTFWVFERMDYAREAENFRPTAEQNEAMKLRGKTFWAFNWYQYEGTCFLQEMDAKEKTVDWYEDRLPMISYDYMANGHSMTAVQYDFSEEMRKAQKERLANGTDGPERRAFAPVLCRVTTNENGEITAVEDMVYIALGLYVTPATAKEYFPWAIGMEEAAAGGTEAAAAAEPVKLQVQYADDADLSVYAGHDEFTADAGQPPVRALFTVSREVKNFRFHTLHMKDVDADGKATWLTIEVYRQDALTPDRPLVVTLVFHGDTPAYAVSYTDEAGNEQYFGVDMSGKDGSLYMFPL